MSARKTRHARLSGSSSLPGQALALAGALLLGLLSGQAQAQTAPAVVTPPPVQDLQTRSEVAASPLPGLPTPIFDTPKPGRWPGSPAPPSTADKPPQADAQPVRQPNAPAAPNPPAVPPLPAASQAGAPAPAVQTPAPSPSSQPADQPQTSPAAQPMQPAAPGTPAGPVAPARPVIPAAPVASTPPPVPSAEQPGGSGGISLQITIPPAVPVTSATPAAPPVATAPAAPATPIVPGVTGGTISPDTPQNQTAAPTDQNSVGRNPAPVINTRPITLPASAVSAPGAPTTPAVPGAPATPVTPAAPSVTPQVTSPAAPPQATRPGAPIDEQSGAAATITKPQVPAASGGTGGAARPGASSEVPKLNFEGVTPAPVTRPASRPPAPAMGMVDMVMPGAAPELEPLDENSPEAQNFDAGRDLGIRDDSTTPLQRFGDSIPNFTRDEMSDKQLEDQRSFTYNRGPAGQMGD